MIMAINLGHNDFLLHHAERKPEGKDFQGHYNKSPLVAKRGSYRMQDESCITYAANCARVTKIAKI